MHSVLEFYKIHNSAGLYSEGGHNPKFSKNGKTWRRYSDVIRHFTSLSPSFKGYKDCKIIHFKYELASKEEISVNDTLSELQQSKSEQLLIRERAAKARDEMAEMHEYQRLRAQFESFRGDPD